MVKPQTILRRKYDTPESVRERSERTIAQVKTARRFMRALNTDAIRKREAALEAIAFRTEPALDEASCRSIALAAMQTPVFDVKCRKGLAWTQADADMIIRLRDEGLLVKQIAKEMGRGESAIRKHIYQMGIGKQARLTIDERAEARRMWESGVAKKDIAAHFNRSKCAISKLSRVDKWNRTTTA